MSGKADRRARKKARRAAGRAGEPPALVVRKATPQPIGRVEDLPFVREALVRSGVAALGERWPPNPLRQDAAVEEAARRMMDYWSEQESHAVRPCPYAPEVVAEAKLMGIPMVVCDGCRTLQPCPDSRMLDVDDDHPDRTCAPCPFCGCTSGTYAESEAA